MEGDLLDSLISEIRKKKELRGVPEIIIRPLLQRKLGKTEKLSDKDKKVIIKEIRADLRKYTGRYESNVRLKEELAQSNDFIEAAKNHISVKERLPFYEKLKELIYSLKPGIILDLGSGLNPILLASRSSEYYAFDINEENLKIVDQFFKANGLKGKVKVSDIRFEEDFPYADVCLIFKVFDLIEDRGHKIAETIIDRLHCKYILVSFSTKKLSGKDMSQPRRIWFEKMLKRKNIPFETIYSANELFYILKRWQE